MTTTSTKATTAKKTPAKATTAKKTPAKATAAKKTPAKTTTAKKTPAKTTTAKKTPAKTTTAKKAETVAPVSNDVAISPSVQSTAITVSSVNDSLSSVLTPALSHPVSVAVGNTVASTVEGFNQIWTHEAEYKTGLQFATLCKDAFVAIVLPILNLLWLALATVYQFLQKPETPAWFTAQKSRVSNWISPVFASADGSKDEHLNLDVDSK